MGRIEGPHATTEVVHRFPHQPVLTNSVLRWDWPLLRVEIRTGLLRACEAAGGRIGGVSCSSWAQDFGLLSPDGELLEAPASYRDSRTAGMPQAFADRITPNDLVRRVGCGVTPVTSLCQLRAMALQKSHVLVRARKLLFVADLVHHALCGAEVTDWTMATASQLRNLHTGAWDLDLLQLLEIPGSFLPTIVARPQVIGLVHERGIVPGLAGVPVISTAGHDTAAAAASIENLQPGTFFLSLGTWGMLGCCTGGLLVPEDADKPGRVIFGLPDERWGVFSATGGLWLLQECRRIWAAQGICLTDGELDRDAGTARIESRIDPAQPRFHAPADMPREIAAACSEAGQPAPRTPGEFSRVIYESLASHYQEALHELALAVGCRPERLHLLGGGTRSTQLCDAIARALGVPVEIGAADATALGNLRLQARVLTQEQQ